MTGPAPRRTARHGARGGRTAIGTDERQPDSANPRPWVRWGTARRDCAPHRGNVLLLLAWVAWVLGLSTFCLVATGWAAVPLAWGVDWPPRTL